MGKEKLKIMKKQKVIFASCGWEAARELNKVLEESWRVINVAGDGNGIFAFVLEKEEDQANTTFVKL